MVFSEFSRQNGNRAKKLFEKYSTFPAPHERNPMTTLFELVEKLNAHF
jgi:hypothetical protein